MILRVFRGVVVPGREARLAEFLRDEAVPGAMTVAGLLSMQPGICRGTETELVLVSTWVDFDALQRGGRDLDTPIAAPGAAAFLHRGRARHYELIVGNTSGLPVPGATLRLLSGVLKPNLESKYFARARMIAEALLDDSRVFSVQLGRRVVGHGNEVVAVTVWRDATSIAEVVRPDVTASMGGPEIASMYDEPPVAEHFEAVISTEPRPDAPALLIADDTRRYVYATPAAAQLTGRSIARLLTMRIDDLAAANYGPTMDEMWQQFLAAGEFAAPFALRAGDGATIDVFAAAKAQSPWPGSHTTLITPGGAEPAVDVEAALVASGVVSRQRAPAEVATLAMNSRLQETAQFGVGTVEPRREQPREHASRTRARCTVRRAPASTPTLPSRRPDDRGLSPAL